MKRRYAKAQLPDGQAGRIGGFDIDGFGFWR
jgi:hypothetical protein